MFLDTEQYPFIRQISQRTGVIRAELQAALRSEVDVRAALEGTMVMDFSSNQWAWESGINQENVGYDLRDGNFSMLAVFKRTDGEVTLDRSSLFPETMALLTPFTNVHYVAFNFLHPGTHLKPHAHVRSHHVFHLLLEDLQDGDCEMICGKESRRLTSAGDHLMFDYANTHETYHRASNVRLNLMVDFLPERAAHGQ